MMIEKPLKSSKFLFGKRIKKFFVIIIAIALGAWITYSLDFYSVKDRLAYFVYALDSDKILDIYKSKGIITIISNEPIFLYLNIFLNQFFDGITIVSIFIYSSYSLTVFLISQKLNYRIFPIFVYTFMPQVLKNNVMQTRQGVAVAIYLFGFLSKNKKVRWLRFIAPFIHTSLAFMLLVELYESIVQKYKLSKASILLFFSIISLTFAQLLPIISQLMGDRRANTYSFGLDQTASGLGFIFWLVFFIVAFKYMRDSEYAIFSLCGIVFYLSTYFSLDIGARILESFLPIIIISVFQLPEKRYKYVLISLLIVYALLGWYSNNGLNGWLTYTY